MPISPARTSVQPKHRPDTSIYYDTIILYASRERLNYGKRYCTVYCIYCTFLSRGFHRPDRTPRRLQPERVAARKSAAAAQKAVRREGGQRAEIGHSGVRPRNANQFIVSCGYVGCCPTHKKQKQMVRVRVEPGGATKKRQGGGVWWLLK